MLPKELTVGLIGLGAMGRRVAARFIYSDNQIYIYDQVDIATRMFSNENGGMMVGSPKMMGQICNVLITLVPDAASVREAAFGWEGFARGLKPGGIVIDMGATDPIATAELAKELAARQITLIDAPAIGTPEDGRHGRLTFLVGGEAAAIEKCKPVFDLLGNRMIHVGPVGSGQAANALADYLRAVSILAASEAMRASQRFGLEPDGLLQAADALGGVGPAIRDALRSQVLTRNFDSGFSLGLTLKDVDNALKLARGTGIHAPLMVACRDAWAAAQEELGSGADHTSMIKWLERYVAPQPKPAAAPAEGEKVAGAD